MSYAPLGPRHGFPLELLRVLRVSVVKIPSGPWIAGAALVLYLLTLAPGVWWIDSGELLAAAQALGLPHAPGASPYVFSGRLLSLLFPSHPDWAVNLLSALAAAFAVGAALHLAAPPPGRGGKAHPDGAALLSAAYFAGSYTLWTQATVAEVYAPLLALLAGALLSLRRHLEAPRPALPLLAAFLFGLAAALRPTGFLFAAVAGTFLAFGVRRAGGTRLLPPRTAVLGTGAFLTGLSTALYLPLRLPHAPFSHLSAPPDRWLPFLSELTGLSFLSRLSRSESAAAGTPLASQVSEFLRALSSDEWGLLGGVLLGAGLAAILFRRRTPFERLLFLLLAADAAAWIPWRPFGQGLRHYVLFSFFLLVPFLAEGIRRILSLLHAAVLRRAVLAVFALGAFFSAWDHFPQADRSRDFAAEDYARSALALTEGGAALYCAADNEYFPLLPRRLREGSGPAEVILIPLFEERRGVSWTASLAGALRRGSVHLSFRDPALADRLLLVPEGPLYRVARTPPVGLRERRRAAAAAFEGGIRLEQAILHARKASESRLAALELVWSRQQEAVEDFWAALHLEDERGGFRLWEAFPPAHGMHPPALWKPREAVWERKVLMVPPDLAAGRYTIHLTLHSASAVEVRKEAPPSPPPSLYAEGNPVARRASSAGAFGRFQELRTEAEEARFLKPLGVGGRLSIRLPGELRVRTGSRAFPFGPRRRGLVEVLPAPPAVEPETRGWKGTGKAPRSPGTTAARKLPWKSEIENRNSKAIRTFSDPSPPGPLLARWLTGPEHR